MPTLGAFLGERYKEKSIIWILGQDRNIMREIERKTIEAIAGGLRDGDNGKHLTTFHPMGPSLSLDYSHEADWLDSKCFRVRMAYMIMKMD